MGGVTASFASLGDVILAEPGAMIGFAGARVIEQATYQVLPEGFQTAEFLWQHGMIDQVVPRADLPVRLRQLLEVYAPLPAPARAAAVERAGTPARKP
jgi:acetyl-CoA carboxylase carboxyl transferase subunit beta